MNVKHTKKPETRVDVKYLSSLGIKTYGDNNLYPQTVRDIVDSSPTGRTCVERRSTYIEGNGLASQALAETVCDTRGNTVDDVHHLCADDVAYQDGLALHVNYNILGQIVSMAHVPFENCRLEEEDDDGIISHIVVHPDWRGKKTRGGKAVKVTIETIEVFPVFNPSPDVVQLQIQAAGGIEFYKGQILYISRAGRNAYPLPLVDVVLNGASSDDGFTEEFEKLQGDTNSLKIMQVEIETDEDKPEFVPFKTNNYDKEFTATTKAVTDNIYAALNQETFGRLRSGSIGFTGDLANDVKREYCEQVAKQQRMLSRAYRAIFSHWEPNTIPYTGAGDATIEPLVKSIANDATSD